MWWGAAWFTERRSSTACVCTRVQHGNEHSRLGLGAVTARVRRVQAAAVAPRTMLESFGWEVKVARRSRFAILAKRVAGGQQHGGGRGACTDGAQTRAPKCLNHDCPSMDSSRAWTHACACKATQEQMDGGGRAGRRRASSYSPKASSPGSTPPIAAMKVWRDCICCQRSSSCAAAAARDRWQAGRGAARGSWTHAREHSWAQWELR